MEMKDGAGLDDGHKTFPYQTKYIGFLDLDRRKCDKHIIVKWLFGKNQRAHNGDDSLDLFL